MQGAYHVHHCGTGQTGGGREACVSVSVQGGYVASKKPLCCALRPGRLCEMCTCTRVSGARSRLRAERGFFYLFTSETFPCSQITSAKRCTLVGQQT